MREIRGVWVVVVVVGAGVVVDFSVRRRTWLREGFRLESKVMGAIGVVVSGCSSMKLSMEESGPGNSDSPSLSCKNAQHCVSLFGTL